MSRPIIQSPSSSMTRSSLFSSLSARGHLERDGERSSTRRQWEANGCIGDPNFLLDAIEENGMHVKGERYVASLGVAGRRVRPQGGYGNTYVCVCVRQKVAAIQGGSEIVV